MNKYSVFGSTGFIGSEYVTSYSDSSISIKREDRKTKSENIIYFISTTNNYHVFDDPYLDINTNLKLLIETLEECKNYQENNQKKVTFNFISSWFVYGDTKLPANEKSNCQPKGFYSITKKCAEDLLISYCQTFDINYRIIRLCNVYGKSDKGYSKKKNALQYMIDRIKSNQEIELYYNGDFYRDYMHVSDVCRAINLIAKSGDLNTIYNVGSGKKIKMKYIIDLCVNYCNSQSIIKPIDSPPFHKIVQVKDMVLDVSKIEKLGFKQKIYIEEGIELLCR